MADQDQLAIPISTPEASVDLGEVHEVLTDALKELESLGRPATASEVRLALKRRTYGGFDFRGLGFKKFRDFLRAAEADGVVELDTTRPGDITVKRTDAVFASGTAPRIRRDVWKALVDWSQGVDHYFDLSTDRVERVPSEPVPLEPLAFRVLRQRATRGDDDVVRIPSVDIKTQVSWMTDFAQALPAGHLQRLLQGALQSEKASKNFNAILRDDDAVNALWLRTLSEHVLQVVEDWKGRDPRVGNIQMLPRESTATSLDPESPVAATHPHQPRTVRIDYAGPTVAWTRKWRTSHSAVWPSLDDQIRPREQSGRETEMRAAVKRAVDRMPLSELERLVIPVGYLWDEV